MATKAELVQVGFNPTFLDAVIQDFAAEAPLVLQAIADFQKLGFGIAWIVDVVTLVGKGGAKLITDLLGLFSTPSPSPVVMTAKAHATAKMATAAPGAHPFLDWISSLLSGAGGQAFFALLLQWLSKIVVPVVP
jgi:hypothetical protein